MKNEILQEVWRHRDDFAREHGYDIAAMVATLQAMERKPLTSIVDRRTGTPFTRVQPTAGRRG